MEQTELLAVVKYSDMPIDCKNKLVEIIKEYYKEMQTNDKD